MSVCNNPYKLLGMCICGWAGGPPDHCVCVCVSCDVCVELAMFLFSPLPTGDLAYVSYCLLQSPYVLTLSFFLLPSLVSTLLLLTSIRDPPWDGKPWAKLRTGPPCGIGGFPRFALV